MQQGTVLAGQDGVSPAISQQTGQPITIEDLLRQRGLMAAGGKMSIYPNVPNASAAGPTAATPVSTSPVAGDPTASSPNPMDIVVNNRIAQSERNVLPPGVASDDMAPQVFDEKPVGVDMPSGDVSDFLPWLIGGAAGGGGIAALLAMRNRRKGGGLGSSGINNPEFGANTGPAPKPGGAANGDGNTAQPRLMQGSNSAVGRARRMNATIASSAKAAPESVIYGEDYSLDAGVRATVGRSVKDAMKKRALKRVRVR